MYSNSVKASLSKRSTLVDDTHSSLLHNTRYRRAGGSEGRTNTSRTGHPTSLPASPARGARSADYCILRGRPTTRRGGETAGDSGTRAWRWRQVDTLLTMNGHRGRVWGARVGRGWFVVVVVVVEEGGYPTRGAGGEWWAGTRSERGREKKRRSVNGRCYSSRPLIQREGENASRTETRCERCRMQRMTSTGGQI